MDTITIAMAFSSLSIFFFSGSFLSSLLFNKRPEKQPSLPPGPYPWPLIGSLPALFREKVRFKWLLRESEGKDICCVKLGNTHAIIVNSPELGREFLKKHDAMFSSRPFTMATEYIGRGFLSAGVSPWADQWRKMRRVVVGKLLSPARLRWQAAARIEEADNLLRYLYHVCKTSGEAEPGAVIDVRLVVRYYCGCIIRRMMFGKRHLGNGAKDGGPGPGLEDIDHIDTGILIDKHLFAHCVSDFLPFLRWFDLDGHEKFMKGAIEVINKYHDPIIEERVEMWKTGKYRKKATEDLLDIMIMLKDDYGKPLLNIEEIKAQTAELVFASIDNPTNIGEWLVAELLNQPDILKKAVEELDRVVGRNHLVQESDFINLPYIRACTRETLRLHPVSPFNLPHVSVADATVAGYFIPKGSQVLLSRVGLNRNAKIWPEPLRFNPERHLKEGARNGLAEPDLRFISFSLGRRSCMGAPLGQLMTYMLVARLLQAFSWELPPGADGIDLAEEEKGFFKARRLHAYIKPRLSLLESV